jgi:hypothetical protein
MTAFISRWAVAAALFSGVLHSSAFADSVAVDKVMLAPASSEDGLFGAPALSGETLDASRGGAEVQVLNKNTLDGVVSDNQAYNLSTGSNLIASGSFANASGQATVIQNSGNNVLIQNATIINLQVQ